MGDQPPSDPTRRWDIERTIFNPCDPVLWGLDPDLVQWFEDHDIMPVACDPDAPTCLIRREVAMAFGEYFLGREPRSRAGPEMSR